jgi:hypothetical protein
LALIFFSGKSVELIGKRVYQNVIASAPSAEVKNENGPTLHSNNRVVSLKKPEVSPP